MLADREREIGYDDNPAFNDWLDENFTVVIADYDFNASEVLYTNKYENYIEALGSFNTDPQIVIDRIFNNFPNPIAHYLYEAENNYQNDHHRLDLLKSCWEATIFLIFGLVVGEARYRNIPLKELGLTTWNKFRSDRVHDKLNIVENILNHVETTNIDFECKNIIPLETLSGIRSLNGERNGFEHASAKTSMQQKSLYNVLFPLVTRMLNQLMGLEKVQLFRYHDAVSPLIPRCEIYNGSSLSGKKDVIVLKKENYFEIIEEFNANSVFAKINNTAYRLSPFIHFYQEDHETNALICFYKKYHASKYKFEVVSKSQDIEINKEEFEDVVNKFKALIL
ncbi:hypothetical protein HNS38_14740 [Lentimicrobium sp. L6]|uniref:hypothetical protein n=1 Tax=Lentimicrobium sp. L6 TaxID=2735916 RepID=UPI00155261EE|nr:hypothetical protein [Lentimicrobium sp. L6]NPD86028.1 hypothetical protein [Lentimicrobium sp. L6]